MNANMPGFILVKIYSPRKTTDHEKTWESSPSPLTGVAPGRLPFSNSARSEGTFWQTPKTMDHQVWQRMGSVKAGRSKLYHFQNAVYIYIYSPKS